MIAEKLGIGPMFTEGKDELDWVEQYYNATDMPKHMTFAEFKEKGYFIVPDNPERKKTPALRWFAEDREKDTPDWGPRLNNQVGRKGLQTSTGKVEFIATSLKNFEDQGFVDEYRPSMHTYVPAWEGPRCELAKKYPLGMLSPHPRFSFHTMGDGKDSFMNDIKDHRVLVDGHYYWIIRINRVDADARGIESGDLVRAFNDRGSVIVCAQVGERTQPGTVHTYESCAEYDPLGKPGRSRRPRRVHEHPVARSLHVQVRVGHGSQHCPDRGREMGRRHLRDRLSRRIRPSAHDRQGVSEVKQWYKVIDVARCHDCNNCFMADKDEFVGNDWPGYTAAQPRHGHRWVDILRRERGQYARNDVAYLPVPCQHCENAPCIEASDGAITSATTAS